VGDEGGFAPPLPKNEEAMNLLLAAIEAAGYRAGEQVAIAIDAAASEYYRDGQYVFAREGHTFKDADEMVAFWKDWCGRYPIVSIEDGMAQDDWTGWWKLTAELGREVQIVGDDLLVTNVERIEKGIREGAANAVLIKPNQIGTLTETLAAIDTAKRGGWRAMIDGGHDDSRPGRGDGLRPDQERRPRPRRADGQVQPPAAHRGGTGVRGQVCRKRSAEIVSGRRDTKNEDISRHAIMEMVEACHSGNSLIGSRA
jgi:hypothetical protein